MSDREAAAADVRREAGYTNLARLDDALDAFEAAVRADQRVKDAQLLDDFRRSRLNGYSWAKIDTMVEVILEGS